MSDRQETRQAEVWWQEARVALYLRLAKGFEGRPASLMRRTIARTIAAPDERGRINALETLVREKGFTLRRELIGTLWQRLQEQRLR